MTFARMFLAFLLVAFTRSRCFGDDKSQKYIDDLIARLGRDDYGDLILVSQGPWANSPTATREFYSNPDPFIVEVFLDGKLKPVAFDMDDIFAAVDVGPYGAACKQLSLISDDCPLQLRQSLLDQMIQSKVSAACRIVQGSPTSTLPIGDIDQCVLTGTRSLRHCIDALVRWTDEDIGSKTPLPSIPLPSFADFERDTYKVLCDVLAETAAALQKKVEGNLWVQGEPEREAFLGALSSMDAIAAATERTTWLYVEIGFNAGHSAAMVLSTFPRARMISFDLCEHAYVRPNFDLIRSEFKDSSGGDRIRLVCGDSRKSLPETLAASTASMLTADASGATRNIIDADVVRVDGGHDFDVASADLINARRLAKRGAQVLLDDCEWVEVQAAWNFAVELGFIRPSRPGLGWKGSCHGHFL